MDARTVIRVLKTLAEPVRLRILHLLANHELAVTELTEILNLGQSRVSGHLAKLADDGFVTTRREAFYWVTVLFTFALLPRLPGLLQHGQRALGHGVHARLFRCAGGE